MKIYRAYVTKTTHWAGSTGDQCACGEPMAIEHVEGHRIELGKLADGKPAEVTCTRCKQIMRDVWEISHTPPKPKAAQPARPATNKTNRGRTLDRRPRRK
jgi:hypothetical protein